MSLPDDLDCDELNRRAFFALRGHSQSVAGDLIALLRSGVPIAPEVREELAAALDGGTIDGVALIPTGNRDGNHSAAAAQAQRDALRIIAFIETLKSQDPNLSDRNAWIAAAHELNKSEGKCKEAWQVHRPRYLKCLAMMERGSMWASIDQAGREAWAMSFAYGQEQQKRKERRKPHKGIRSA